MSNSSLFRFRIELSDVERSIYRELDFRIARHPSENEEYLLTRVIAYALNQTEADDLEISPGLCADDQPALSRKDGNGTCQLWIEIGNPSPRRLHKAAKASRALRVYTYKDPENLKREARDEEIHKKEDIEIFSVDPKFLKSLAAKLDRDNRWGLIFNDGELTFSIGDESLTGTLHVHRLVSETGTP